MLISNLFLLFCIVSIPLYFLFNPPSKINFFYGYRTKRAMKNQSYWDFANQNFIAFYFKYSMITAMIQILLFIFMDGLISVIVASVLWLIAMFLSIYLTEQKLNKKERSERD